MQDRFSPISGVMQELKEGKIVRQFLLRDAPTWALVRLLHTAFSTQVNIKNSIKAGFAPLASLSPQTGETAVANYRPN
jgi:hypothetical protein